MPPEPTPAAIGLIVIGDEILSGRRRDQHLAKLIELLAERGLVLGWARYLGDDEAQITAVLREVFAGPDLVFCTGGIGATPDDRTRQAAAAALGVPLQLHPQARRLIEQRQQAAARAEGQPWEPQRADNLQRLKLGEFPAGAAIVPNPYNQIPGFSCRGAGGSRVYFTPGFPVMAWPMMAWALEAEAARALPGAGWRERSIIVMGTAESVLTPFMEQLEQRHPQVRVFSLPSVDHPDFGAHIDLGVKGPAAAVDAAFDALLAMLQPLHLRYGPQRSRP